MKNNIKEDIYFLVANLRGLGIFEVSSKLIQILFLKTIIDDVNKYENLSIETMKVLFDYQKKFVEGEVTEELLYKAFQAVENANRLEKNELTSGIGLFRFYFERDNQKRINSNLMSIEIPSNYSERKELFSELLNYIGLNSLKYSGETITSPSIYRIANELLKVKPDDRVLNTFAGSSAFVLNLGEFHKAYGYEINIETYTITYMLKIMCGIKNYDVVLNDFYHEDINYKFDKIFTDGQLMSYKIRNLPETKDADILNFKKTYDLLSDNGIAIVSAPNRVLTAGTKQYQELRKSFLNMGLKAIITLPNNVIYGSTIPINLFLFKKGYSGNILIVNVPEDKFDSTKLLRIIKVEAVNKIFEIIENNEVVDNFSCSISPEVLFGDGNNPVSLQKFFMQVENKLYRAIKDIDYDIEKTITELINLNK